MGEKRKKSVGSWIFIGGGILFAAWLFWYPTSRRHHPREGLVMASSLASAVENFYAEYNHLPNVGGDRVLTDGPAGKRLLEILLGLEGPQPEPQNARSVIFLQGKEAKGRKGGITYGPGDTVEGVYDPYGNPYTVVLNSKDEDELVFQYGGQTVRLRGKQVAVWSVGKDGKEGTKDDVKSWHYEGANQRVCSPAFRRHEQS